MDDRPETAAGISSPSTALFAPRAKWMIEATRAKAALLCMGGQTHRSQAELIGIRDALSWVLEMMDDNELL